MSGIDHDLTIELAKIIVPNELLKQNNSSRS